MPSWHEFRNDSTEPIPAYGVLRLTGLTVPEPGRVVLLADKPNAYGCQHRCLLNGPAVVGMGKYGVCTREAFCAALYETADDVPAAGERWGPRPGSWKLRKHTGGFAVVGVTRSAAGLVLVQPAPMLTLLGKTDAPHNRNSAGTISIFAGPLGFETDTQHDLTGVYNRFGDVPAGKWVRCLWNDQSNDWELLAAEC